MIQTLGIQVCSCPDDGQVLTQQLGDRPMGIWAVAVRHPTQHHPMVLATYPFLDKPSGQSAPFPNTLWLTDPALSRQISELERLGVMDHFHQTLADDADLAQQMQQDHQRYARMRWAMLRPEDQAYARKQGWESALRHRGVGGLDPQGTRLKCLHAHVAHHLYAGNAMGLLVLQRLGFAWPV